MVDVTYIGDDGSAITVDVPAGTSVMEGATENNIPGMVAECGGACACATCHVFVRREGDVVFPPAEPEELELLEFVDGFSADSRLSCQLIIAEGMSGIRVEVAESNG